MMANRWRRCALLGVALACGPAVATDSGSRDRFASVVLTASRINAGATGRATLVPLGERTQVTVVVSGVPPMLSTRPVHLYTFLYRGTCASAAPEPAYALNDRVLAQSPSSTAIAAAAGPFTITNVAPVALDALQGGRYAIRIMTSPADGNREIFCGDVP